jgi:hypothetical protein
LIVADHVACPVVTWQGAGKRRGSDTQSCPADNALSPPCQCGGVEQEAVTNTLATLMQEVASLRRQFTKFADEERTALAELRYGSHICSNIRVGQDGKRNG